jgi:serine/threonine-protein kinase HipA
MVRRPARIPLNVYLNARLVGRLNKESSGAIEFQYDAGWLGWDNAIPVSLSLPLREDKYIGTPVVAVFDNLLPDNEGTRRRVAERAHAAGSDAYSLLSAIGRDCVGALQFVPDGMPVGEAGQIDARPVTNEEIATLINDLARNPLGIGDEDPEFRISIAGAQEKTALLKHEGRWHLPHGTTATTHIFKPQIGQLPNGIDLSNSVENEHLCLEIVRALDLPAAKSEINDFGGRKCLVVERFDRVWTKDGRLLRLPQEDCCQALSIPPSRKYESDGGPGISDLIGLLKGSDYPQEDQRILFKAQIVFWLLAATDGHAKNFSIRLSPGGRFRLTPLYDVVSVQPSFDAHQIRLNQMKLAMPVGTKRHYTVNTIAGRHFLQTAELCSLPVKLARNVIDEIGDTGATKIDQVLSTLPSGYPEQMAASVSNAAKNRIASLLRTLTTPPPEAAASN